MNIISRKEITSFGTSFLLRLKSTLLKIADHEKMLTKPQTHMLIDVLSELDDRKYCNLNPTTLDG